MEGYIGAVTCFAGSFIPKNWMSCDGQLLKIASYQALFSILGDFYGGDGVTTFGLPDLRGRTPVSANYSGITPIGLGQMSGAETATIGVNQMPVHTHINNQTMAGMQANSNDGIDANPIAGYPSKFTGAYGPTPNCTMVTPQTFAYVDNCGLTNPQPFPTLPPFQALNYIICINGIYPSRN